MGFMFWIWIIVLVIAVIVEISTTDLTSIWFAAGALGALISNMFLHDEYISIQVTIFAIIAIVSIVAFKPIIKKRMNTLKIATNVDALIGEKVLVVEKIELNYPGAVKAEGIEWTAITMDETFLPGDFVEVSEIKGNTLTVKKIN